MFSHGAGCIVCLLSFRFFGALAQTDETAIALFESQAAQESIDAQQDDALLDIYEMLGG